MFQNYGNVTIDSRLAGIKTLFERLVLAPRRAGVVTTFRPVYYALLQEIDHNAKLQTSVTN